MSKATEISTMFEGNQRKHFNPAGGHIDDVCKSASADVIHSSPYGQGSILYTFEDGSKVRTWPAGFGFPRAWQIE